MPGKKGQCGDGEYIQQEEQDALVTDLLFQRIQRRKDQDLEFGAVPVGQGGTGILIILPVLTG